jgi:hypothetical protein
VNAQLKAKSEPDQPQQKFFYLVCGFCRWSTRDIGLLDVSVGWFGFTLFGFVVSNVSRLWFEQCKAAGDCRTVPMWSGLVTFCSCLEYSQIGWFSISTFKINELIEGYRHLVMQEKAEKDDKKNPFAKRKVYQTNTANVSFW